MFARYYTFLQNYYIQSAYTKIFLILWYFYLMI